MRESGIVDFLIKCLDFCQERVVDLGPFKHKVDDGLAIRKAALMCCDSVLGVMPEQMDCTAVLHKLVFPTKNAEGKSYIMLKNDKDEVKFNAYQVLAKLCECAPGITFGALDHIAVVLTHLIVKAKLGTNNPSTSANNGKPESASPAPGRDGSTPPPSTDTGRVYELVRAACQVIVLINAKEASGGVTVSAAAMTTWRSDFMEKEVLSRPAIVDMLQSIQNEQSYQ